MTEGDILAVYFCAAYSGVYGWTWVLFGNNRRLMASTVYGKLLYHHHHHHHLIRFTFLYTYWVKHADSTWKGIAHYSLNVTLTVRTAFSDSSNLYCSVYITITTRRYNNYHFEFWIKRVYLFTLHLLRICILLQCLIIQLWSHSLLLTIMLYLIWGGGFCPTSVL